MAVIDASVYVTLVKADEADHAKSWAWFEQAVAAGEPIYAPAILIAEVASALSRGLQDPGLARQILRQLLDSELIDLLPVTRALAEQAAGAAVDHQIRGCDAVYVALARELGDCLITLDRQQLERGAAIVKVRTP